MNFFALGLVTVLGLFVIAIPLVIWQRRPIFESWNQFYDSWTRLSNFAKHLILAVSLSSIVALFGLSCGWFAKAEARQWLCEYDPDTYRDCPQLMAMALDSPSATPAPSPTSLAPEQIPQRTTVTSDASASTTPTSTPTPVPSATPVPLTADQNVRLNAQAARVRALKRHHASVMAFFSQAYYTAICVLLFAGAMLAICMFFVGTSGWAQTNRYVRTIFVVMAATVAFYGLWPPVFQQEKNLSDNKALFLQYATLQNEIASYPVTRTNLKNELKAPNDFINYVDLEMARLGNIAVGFDYTQISYKGAFESNSSNSPAPPPGPTQTPKKTP